MRCLLALTALVAAVVAANRGEVQPYAAGKEFVYIYDGQVASGIPGASTQHAVTRIQARVHLVFKTETQAVLKLQNVRVASESRELIEPREVLPMGAFHSSEETIDQEKLEKLTKPVSFKYAQGIVSQLQFEHDEPTWSANVKRGIINLLQVNIKQTGRTDLDEENKLHNQQREPKEYTNDFFTAYEKSLEGDCETMYTITMEPMLTYGQHSQQQQNSEVMNITKSINFEKCKRRPQIKYNMRFGEKCPSCENKFSDDEKTTKSSTVIKYNISGTIDRFAIERVMVHSQYVFAPLADHSSVLITHVKAHLKLEKHGKQETEIQEPTGQSKEELVYSPKWDQLKERFHMEGDEEFSKRSEYTHLTNKVEAVEQVLRKMLRSISDEKRGIEHEATRQAARLVQLLRLCTEADLQRVHTELFEGQKFEETEKHKVRDILIDSLALAGTKVTIEHLVHKIKQRQVTPARAAHALKALVNVRVTSEKQIDAVLRLCKDTSVVENSGSLKQSCLLTVGAMINALCKENEDKLAIQSEEEQTIKGRYQGARNQENNLNSQDKICPRGTKQRYVEELYSFFEKAETRYEKVLALKALANAGLDMSIFKLEELIKDRSEDKLIRAEAIDALRQLRSQMPRKIQKILMPVFASRHELPTLRMLAFAKIIDTQPERAVLDQIAQHIYRERSTHVHAFVYSMLRTLANSTIPCEKQTAEDLQTSLRMARVPELSQSARSTYWHLPLYSEEQKMGLSVNLASMFTNTSYLPAELMASLDTILMGDWQKNAIQMGLVQRDIEPAVERVLRQLLSRPLQEVMTRGKRASGSNSESYRPAEMLRDLFNKLGIQSRRQSGEDSKPFAMLYIRYKDMDYALLPLDESTMPEALKQISREGKIDMSALERLFAQGHSFQTHAVAFVYESMKKMPTTIGIPIQISNKMPLVAKLNAHISAQIEPSNGKSVRGVRAKVVAHVSLAATHVTTMELWWPVVNSGVKVVASAQINLPINLEAEFNMDKKQIVQLIVKAPEQEKRILSIHTRPVTFIRSWPKSSRVYIDSKERTIHHEEQSRVSTVERLYGQKMGVEMSVQYQWHRTPFNAIKGTPMSLLAGENLVEIYVKPGQNAPKDIVFSLSGQVFGTPDEDSHKPEHKNFYNSEEDDKSSESDRFNREENNGEYDNEEHYNKEKKSRRDNFEKYTKEYSSDKSYKHGVKLEMETRGGKEMKGDLEVYATCDSQMRFCKIQAQAKRSAMLEGENRQWMMKAKAQTLYPQTPYSMETLKEQSHREFNAQIDAEWGSEEKFRINLRVQGEQSRQAKMLIEEMTNKGSEYRSDERQYREGKMNKQEQLERAAYLDQYKLEGEYTLNPYAKNITYKLYSWVKAALWSNSEVRLGNEQQTKQSGRISALWSIDPQTRNYLNLSISSPVERVSFIDIRLPFDVSPLNIRRSSPEAHSFSQLMSRGQSMNGECRVDGKRIETFDEVEYKTKMTNCYVLLAKDCSDESRPSFAVLMKKTGSSGEEKTIKIISESKEIEIEMKSGEMKVKVNGEHIQERRQLAQHGIEKQEDQYKVELEEAGVKVYFDGYKAHIKASDKQVSSQCGLCGNYNGDRDDEWRMPNNEVTSDFDEFRRSYDNECKETKDKKGSYKYEEEDNNEDDSSEEQNSRREQSGNKDNKGNKKSTTNKDGNRQGRREQEPIKVTAVMEQDGEICFSKTPILDCPESGYIKESKKQTVAFVCEERTREALQKARDARRRTVEVSGPVSFSETVRVAVTCGKYDSDEQRYEY